MKLSGYNLALAVRQMRYPYEAAIRSALNIADEFCVACDPRYDDPAIFTSIDSRVKIVEVEIDFTEWDFINKGLTAARRACLGDWCLFMEHDEVFHEKDAAKIKEAISEAEAKQVEAVAISYIWMCHDYVEPKAFKGNLRQKITRNLPCIYHQTADYMVGEIDSLYMDGKRVLPGFDDVAYYDERTNAWFNFKTPVVLEDYTSDYDGSLEEEMAYKAANYAYVWHYCQYNWGRKLAQYRKQFIWQRRTYGDTPDMDLAQNEHNMQSPMAIDPSESKLRLQERIDLGWIKMKLSHPRFIDYWLDEMQLEAT